MIPRRPSTIPQRRRRLAREEWADRRVRHVRRERRARVAFREAADWCRRHGVQIELRRSEFDDGPERAAMDRWIWRTSGGRVACWTPRLASLRIYDWTRPPDARGRRPLLEDVKCFDVGQVMGELELIWALDARGDG